MFSRFTLSSPLVLSLRASFPKNPNTFTAYQQNRRLFWSNNTNSSNPLALFRSRLSSLRFSSTNIGSVATKIGETYAKPLIWLHWIGAVGMTGLVISGWVAGTIPNDPEKTPKDILEFRGKLMHLHESVGLLMLGFMFPRVAIRLTSRIPPSLPGPAWEQFLGKVSHYTLYGMIVFMPVSGLAFGYASGWGVPFFIWNVPGAPKEKVETETYKAIEKFFYENHHRVGQALEYLLPIHVGAVLFHQLYRGHKMIQRMNPFAKSVVDAAK